jgi:hypothetical protein
MPFLAAVAQGAPLAQDFVAPGGSGNAVFVASPHANADG